MTPEQMLQWIQIRKNIVNSKYGKLTTGLDQAKKDFNDGQLHILKAMEEEIRFQLETKSTP